MQSRFLNMFFALSICFSSLTATSIWAQNKKELLSMYLGGKGHNSAVATAVLNNQLVAVAGTFTEVNSATTFETINIFNSNAPATARVLLIQIPSGNITTVYNLGNEIYDMESLGNILYVVSDLGIVSINTTTHKAVWGPQGPASTKNTGAKLAVDVSGLCFALIDKIIYCYETNGVVTGSYNVGHNYCNDIAVYNNTIFVAGYDSKINSAYTSCGYDPGSSYDPVDVAFIDAFSFTPNTGNSYRNRNINIKYSYSTYNFEGAALACDMSSTQINKLAIGKDGFLYLLGSADGPKNIFRWNGKTTWKLNGGANPQAVYSSGYDNYHNVDMFPEGTPSQFVGKINIADGKVVNGFFSNTFSALTGQYDFIDSQNGALYVDSERNVYVGSMAGNSIPNRAYATTFNQTLAPYSAGDPALMSIGNMSYTSAWNAFTDANGAGTIVDIDMSSSGNYYDSKILVAIGELSAGNATVNKGTPKAYNPSPTDNANDVFLAVYTMQFAVTAITNNGEDSTKSQINENCECILVKSNQKQFLYQIFDVKGILVKQENCETDHLTINKNDLGYGFYILKVFTKDSAITHKFDIK